MSVIPLRDRPTARYRFYDMDGAPIYIGVAVDLEQRWRFHRAVAAWWHLVDHNRTMVDWYSNRSTAEAAEVEAITLERPIYNIAHTDRSLRAAPQPSRWSDARAAGITARSRGSRIMLSVQETRAQLKSVVNAVSEAGRKVIVIRHSAPAAVFVPMDWYRQAAEKMGEPTDL